MRSAGLPVILIGSPIIFADRLIGSPISWPITTLRARLAGVLSGGLGAAVPVTLAALEALRRLLAVLEEVDSDTRQLLHAPLMLKLVSASLAVRQQVRRALDPRASRREARCGGTPLGVPRPRPWGLAPGCVLWRVAIRRATP